MSAGVVVGHRQGNGDRRPWYELRSGVMRKHVGTARHLVGPFVAFDRDVASRPVYGSSDCDSMCCRTRHREHSPKQRTHQALVCPRCSVPQREGSYDGGALRWLYRGYISPSRSSSPLATWAPRSQSGRGVLRPVRRLRGRGPRPVCEPVAHQYSRSLPRSVCDLGG